MIDDEYPYNSNIISNDSDGDTDVKEAINNGILFTKAHAVDMLNKIENEIEQHKYLLKQKKRVREAIIKKWFMGDIIENT